MKFNIVNKIDYFDELKHFRDLSAKQIVYWIITLVSAGICFVGLINNIFFGCALPLDKLMAVFVILISVYLCAAYRYNIGLFIVMVFMAYANYSISVAVYLSPNIRPSALYNQFSAESLSIALLCMLIFEFCILLFSKKIIYNPKSIESRHGEFIQCENNTLIAYGCLVLYVLVFFLTFKWNGVGTRGGGSSITEYRTVIAIIGFYYSGKKKSLKWLWTIIILVISGIVFVSLNRVDAFSSVILLVVYWWYDFVTYKKLLIALPFAAIAMIAIGGVRDGLLSDFSLNNVVKLLFNNSFAWDTAYYAYVPSVAIAEIADKLSFSESFKLFWKEILSIFVGSTNSYSGMSIYTRQYYLHYYGCITPVYFYAWLSYVSPAIVAALYLMYVRFYRLASKIGTSKLSSKIKYAVSLYMICNVARWYCYGPAGLLRNMFVLIVVLLLSYGFDLLSKRITSRIIK